MFKIVEIHDSRIDFRVSAEAKALYEQRARASGFNKLSQWLRALAVREIRSPLPGEKHESEPSSQKSETNQTIQPSARR